MEKQINPRLIELARKTYNPNLEMPNLEEKAEQTPKQEFAGIDNPQDYLLLEGRSHGDYSYPDLLVCKYRLDASQEAIKAGMQLGLKLQNTGVEENGRGYIGNINWESAIKLALLLGKPLTIRQGIDFLLLLKSRKAFDGKGNRVDSKELEQILGEIIGMREPWRTECLDASFEKVNGIMHIKYGHKLVNKDLKPVYDEPIEKCLMEDFYSEKIDLESCNNQGLPAKKGKNINYWYPREGYVARFGAGSGGACLSCNWRPDGSDSSLGVRVVREAHALKQEKAR